jgi:hypothetical protein
MVQKDAGVALAAHAGLMFSGVMSILTHPELEQRVKAKRLRDVLRVLADFTKQLTRHASPAQVFATLIVSMLCATTYDLVLIEQCVTVCCRVGRRHAPWQTARLR